MIACLVIPVSAAMSDGLRFSGPGYSTTFRWAEITSSNPASWRPASMRSRTSSQGRRSRAPIKGGPSGYSGADVVKSLDISVGSLYGRQVTLPLGGTRMSQSSSSAITVGPMEIRFLVEGSESGGSVSVFECDVPADAMMGGAPQPRWLRGDDLRTRGNDDLDRQRRGARDWLRASGVHSQGSDPRVRESRHRRCDVPRDRNPGRLRSRVLSRDQKVLAASAGGPPDLAAIGDVMRRHGLTPAPPATTSRG